MLRSGLTACTPIRLPRSPPQPISRLREKVPAGRMSARAQRAAFGSLRESRSRARFAELAPPHPALRSTFSRRREQGFVRGGRKTVVKGKSVSVRVNPGGPPYLKQKTSRHHLHTTSSHDT